MKYFKIPWLSIIIALVISGCGSQKDDVVAIVDGEEIFMSVINEDFELRAASFFSYEKELEARTEAVDSLINIRLLVRGAYAAGLELDQEVRRIANNQRSSFLFDELYRQEILPQTEVTDREVEEFYEKLEYEYRFAHILVETESEIDSIYEEIQNGADFAMIARTISLDQSSAVSGGDIGFVSWASPLAPEFQEVAFKLEMGEISKPVKTDFGWHIIRLLETRPGRTGIPEQAFPMIRQILEQRKAAEAELIFFDKMREKANIQINKEATDLLLDKLQRFFPPTVLNVDRPDNFFPDLEILQPAERDMIFATYLGGELTIENYINKIADVQSFYRPKFSDHDSLKKVIFQLELRNIMEFEAEERNVQQGKDYILRTTNFKEGVMTEKFQQSILGRDLEVFEEEINEYYNDHLEDFKVPQRFYILEIESSTAEEAEKILSQLKSGADFKSLASQHTTRPGAKPDSGDLGFILDYRHPMLYQAAQQLKTDEISEVIGNARGYYSVIKLLSAKAAAIRPVNDCVLEIKRIVIRKKRDNVVDQWLEKERANRDIQIFKDVIEESIDKSKYDIG